MRWSPPSSSPAAELEEEHRGDLSARAVNRLMAATRLRQGRHGHAYVMCIEVQTRVSRPPNPDAGPAFSGLRRDRVLTTSCLVVGSAFPAAEYGDRRAAYRAPRDRVHRLMGARRDSANRPRQLRGPAVEADQLVDEVAFASLDLRRRAGYSPSQHGRVAARPTTTRARSWQCRGISRYSRSGALGTWRYPRRGTTSENRAAHGVSAALRRWRSSVRGVT